jgi:hypothetical protein
MLDRATYPMIDELIRSGRAYINVLTKEFMGGAIRGQLMPLSPLRDAAMPDDAWLDEAMPDEAMPEDNEEGSV